MGCDIHIVIERKYKDKWVGVRTDQSVPTKHYNEDGWDYNSPAVGWRDYGFFARLAGVRGSGPNPEGVPDDASDLTRALVEQWDSDGHSYSHLPLEEFAQRWVAGDDEFLAARTKERLEGGDTLWARTLDKASIGAFDGYADDINEFRVVFWFDN